eukprot:Selendium_serpulae@DN2924_c0_g1_i1.p1
MSSEVAHDKILVLDFGSQYTHLIVRRCREARVFAEVKCCTTSLECVQKYNPKGIILSGGPSSVFHPDAPHAPTGMWQYAKTNSIPILGICYGLQEMMHILGGKAQPGEKREYGMADLMVKMHGKLGSDPLFQGLKENPTRVWMSHSDCVSVPAPGFEAIAITANSEYAAVSFPERKLWGLQFHPEVTHTTEGATIIENFCVGICGAKATWDMEHFAAQEVQKIVAKVGDHPVVGALSGGVDSTVAAALVHKAVGDKFHGFMIDTGLLRKDEGQQAIASLKQQGLKVEIIDAQERFLTALKGVSDPEQKRKIIGNQFVEEFQNAAHAMNLPKDSFLLQGTLYTDVIESMSSRGPSHKIKTHHNVGGLPAAMKLTVLEPLRNLFKDEVRALGEQLGLDSKIVWRHPFPGPGLAIRILGTVDSERVAALQQADYIFLEEIRKSGEYDKIAQAFVVLLPDARSVGVMGDRRTYNMTCVLRAVSTTDFMTADWYRLSPDTIAKCSSRIVNEVNVINRVCYDVTSKPPGTVEWE